MPSMLVLGRRWKLGADDLAVPSFIGLVLRFTWATLLVVLRGLFRSRGTVGECAVNPIFDAWFIGSVIVFGLSGVLQSIICMVSMRGSILQVRKRATVPKLLFVFAVFTAIEIIWTVGGSVIEYRGVLDCVDEQHSQYVHALFRALIISQYVLLGLLLVFVIFVLGSAENQKLAMQTSAWETRLRRMFCCTRADDHIFGQISALIDNVFEEWDVVPSDVAAGLILAHARRKASFRVEIERLKRASNGLSDEEQPQRRFAHLIHPRFGDGSEICDAFDIKSNKNDKKTLEALLHFLPFSMGVFGAPMYLYVNHVVPGVCNLGLCGCCSTPLPPHLVTSAHGDRPVRGSDCCGWNLEAMRMLSNTRPEDVLLASFDNELHQPPFCVYVDRVYRSIVVAIRGTMSMADTLTDLTAFGSPFDLPDVDEPCLAHSGMLAGSEFVRTQIIESHVLERALGEGKEFSDYSFVIVGHSLGAGIAAILACQLQSHPQFGAYMRERLHCYSYQPPSATLSEAASNYAKSFVTSVVLNDDIVSRLTLPNVIKMRDEIQSVLSETWRPKANIFCSAMCCSEKLRSAYETQLRANALGERSNGDYEPPSTDHSERTASDDAESPLVSSVRRRPVGSQSTPRSTRVSDDNTDDPSRSLLFGQERSISFSQEITLQTRLVMPGRVVHFRRIKTGNGNDAEYRPCWVDGSRAFEPIILSARMMKDHMPDRLEHVMRSHLVDNDSFLPSIMNV